MITATLLFLLYRTFKHRIRLKPLIREKFCFQIHEKGS